MRDHKIVEKVDLFPRDHFCTMLSNYHQPNRACSQHAVAVPLVSNDSLPEEPLFSPLDEALVSAASNGDLGCLHYFQSKYNINWDARVDGNTALLQASKNGHIEVCKFLVSCGAGVNICNNLGRSPLRMAGE